jgi:hypothetical protein
MVVIVRETVIVIEVVTYQPPPHQDSQNWVVKIYLYRIALLSAC